MKVLKLPLEAQLGCSGLPRAFITTAPKCRSSLIPLWKRSSASPKHKSTQSTVPGSVRCLNVLGV